MHPRHPSNPPSAQVRVLNPAGSPPHDLEAEAAVLGAILVEPTLVARLADLVDAADFYRENNGVIFSTMLAVADRGHPVSSVTVASELEAAGVLDRVGGRAHLALLIEHAPPVATAEHFAREVHQLAVKRRIVGESLEVARAAHDRRVELAELGERVDALRDTAGREVVWRPPLPLVDRAEAPSFPVEALPAWCAAYADALAEATQTPPDLAGMCVLACLATCAGGRVRVEIRPGWEEPLNLYAVVALPPGERKSAVFEAATAPLSEFEEERARALAPVVVEAGIRRRALDRAVESAQNEAARANTTETREAAIERAAALAHEAEAVIVPAPYRLLADDATPEALASLLAEQGGRMAVLSPEGGVFGQMAGRYSGGRGAGANLDVYLKGHAGDRMRVDRKGRPPEYVARPALTIGLAVQPDVLRTLSDVPELRGVGILARFLYALPASRIGKRRPNPAPVPPELAHEYASKLCMLARNLDGVGGWRLRFAPAGRELLDAYAAALEPRLGEDGDLRHMADWAGKLAGAVARIAALVHLGGSVRGAWGDEVPAGAVEAAISIGDYAVAHARAVFALMGADPQVELARRLLRWIADRDLGEFTRRDAFDQLRGARLTKVTDLDAPLALLVAHEYLVPIPSVRGGAGGRPSLRFRVNPLTQNPQNTQNPAGRGGSAGFAGFALEDDR